MAFSQVSSRWRTIKNKHEGKTRLAIVIGIGVLLLLYLLPNVAAKAVSFQRVPWEDIKMSHVSASRRTLATGQINANGDVLRIVHRLIACESQGHSIRILDSNGQYSYGVLMFQMATWNEFSAESGITGDPMVPADAIRMATWAIEHGYLSRWTCARILGLV